MNDGGRMAVSPHRPGIIFCTGNVYDAAYFIGVSHTTDDGAAWEHDTIALGSRGWAVAFDPLDSSRVYVGGDSAYSYPCLLVTTDLGLTWTQSRAGLSGAVNALATGIGATVFAGTANGVFRSTDAGATWTATALATNTKTLVVDPWNQAIVYAGTYGQGVYVTGDAGATWSPMNDGLTNLKVLSLDLRPGMQTVLFAGTEGGAVFRLDPMTGVADDRPAVPTGTAPFATIVRGVLDLTSDFCPLTSDFVLVDACGRKVMELTPGANDVTRLAPGVYFLRAASGVEPPASGVRKVVIQ